MTYGNSQTFPRNENSPGKSLANKVCWISCVHSIKEVLMLIEGCACMLTHLTLCDPRTVACQPACPWNSPGKNTGVGCHLLLQGIFRTQGSNLALLHCIWILHSLSHQGRQFTFMITKIRIL